MKSILITGGSGLIGSAMKQIMDDYKLEFYCTFLNSKQCDLCNYSETLKIFSEFKPDIIIHLAACVGGLFKNMSDKVRMLEENVLINTHVVKAAHESGVQTLIGCLSTCIFPDQIENLNENIIHDGPPHFSNEGYAYAKRLMDIHCRVYRQSFNRNYFCIIPTNIYGPNDNFNLEDGHVIPSLIHKAYLSKQRNNFFEIRGSGKPLRQFIYSLDIAKLIFQLMEQKVSENIILSPSDQYSIKEVAEIINKHFENDIVFNNNYADGQYSKTTDNSKLKDLFNFEFTSLEQGISETVEWFKLNYNTLRK